MQRRALVTGASIAGLSTAFWLARTGWRVEVLERSDTFRDGGQNVDIRGAAHDVIQRTGLTDAVRARNTTEEGTAFIGEHGQLLGRIPVEAAEDGPTAELEILRGDLARLILDALPADVTVRYGDHIVDVADQPGMVRVQFEHGPATDYDLLVVAEGVRSRTRRIVFGDRVQEHELGLNMAYGTIPRTSSDDHWWRWYAASGRRGITLRPDNAGTIRATLAYIDRAHRLADLPLPEAKQHLREVFADAGWEADRVSHEFLHSDDVYVDSLTQIQVADWAHGRTVLIGDAAWCVTPLGGGGTSLAVTGAYVLAAYLSTATDKDLGPALQAYQEWMRPLIDNGQNLPPGSPDLYYPDTRAGVEVMRTLERVITTRPARSLATRFSHVAQSDQDLPPLQSAGMHSAS